MNPASPLSAADQTVAPLVRYIDLSQDFENGAALSNFVAVHEDGTCVVVKEEAHNPEVRKLLKEVEARHGLRIQRRYGSVEEVAELRRKGLAGRRGETDSEMQTRILDLIEDAQKANASDIHIEVGSEITTVQFRVDGRLIKKATWPTEIGRKFLGAAYAMAELANQTFSESRFLAARLAPRPDRDQWAFPQGLEAVRMQFNPVAFGYSYAVFRLLGTTNITADAIESLGYEPEQLPTLTAFAMKNKGLGIISGPTGSGKSTTMCALIIRTREIDQMMNNPRALFTVEDPPERRLPGAQQLIVPNTANDEDRSRAYADAIRAAMRSDPDIIMIGEIRDRTTANLAVSASMTGHQVWSTLHCSSAHAIPMRLHDLGVERSVIFESDELFVAAAQVLVPLLCQSCRVHGTAAIKSGRLDALEAERLTRAFGQDFYIAGPGCAHCGNSGVKGRTVIAEVIRTDNAYMNILLRDGMAAAREFCRARGEPSMADVGARKVARGIVSALDVARVVDLNELGNAEFKVAAE